MIKVVFFDFGGVLAEEGFREGLLAIARNHGLDPEAFLKTAVDLTFNHGFVTGKIDVKMYWQMLREKTGINASDEALSHEVLSRFIIRPWMLDIVKKLKPAKIRVTILSDQTKWLDEFAKRYGFSHLFERIFNSYYLGMCKRDPELFSYVVAEMKVKPEEALLIDDNQENIERAKQRGLKGILFQTRETFESELRKVFPFLESHK
ncbi:MAG TPA: HAD family phosphatase [Thermodesulfobacteriota bacterium]|nr:HAD family phosphatase [Thermodesulfobacteriota bacterium]